MKRSLCGLLALIAGYVPVTHAADVLIHVTGNIKVNTCELNAASQDLTVPMKGAILSEARYQIGDAFEPTTFSISISKCSGATTRARITFSGATNVLDNSVLAISGGGARGVGIQLRDAQNSLVALNQASSVYELQPDTDNTLTFSARYVATAPVLSPGQADAVANFAIEYE